MTFLPYENIHDANIEWSPLILPWENAEKRVREGRTCVFLYVGRVLSWNRLFIHPLRCLSLIFFIFRNCKNVVYEYVVRSYVTVNCFSPAVTSMIATVWWPVKTLSQTGGGGGSSIHRLRGECRFPDSPRKHLELHSQMSNKRILTRNVVEALWKITTSEVRQWGCH